jgi:hypothetical protein
VLLFLRVHHRRTSSPNKALELIETATPSSFFFRLGQSVRELRKLMAEHRIRKLAGTFLGHLLGQDLIELTAKDLFRLPAVKVRWLAQTGPHGTDHLPEERLSNELRESLADLDRLLVRRLLYMRGCRAPIGWHAAVTR